jgi:two-component sensor histidine kinase
MWILWCHWFVSDGIGIVSVAPLIVGIAKAVREAPPRHEIIEGSIALLVLTTTTAIIAVLPQRTWQTVRPAALLLPLLLWLAARCQPAFTAAAAFIVSLAVMWTTTFGIGHFGDPALPIFDRIAGAQAGILVFSVCAYVLAALSAERREAAKHQDMLIAELDHRVKNMLARVRAVAMHMRRSNRTVDEFIAALDGRIRSMANAHSLLSRSRWSGVSFIDLIRGQLAPYTTGANISLDGPDIVLTVAETQALAMVVHELAANAAKYGALSQPEGTVSVSWDCPGADPAVLKIVWRERGGPPVAAPVQPGYGSSLVRNLIPHELDGTVDLSFSPDGVCCKIEIPLKRRAAAGTRIARTAADEEPPGHRIR